MSDAEKEYWNAKDEKVEFCTQYCQPLVGGVPAKPIRKRFDDETIQKLEDICWWNWDENQIRQSIKAIQHGDKAELEKISNE